MLSLRIHNLDSYIYSGNFCLVTAEDKIYLFLSIFIWFLTSEFLHLDFNANPTDLPDLMLSLSSAGHAL